MTPRTADHRPSVLLLRALGLGDFLTGVPAYRAVRRAFPHHAVVLAAPSALADLVPLTGAIDRLLPTAELQPVSWVGPPPDLGIDLHGNGPASHDLVARLHPARALWFGVPGDNRYSGPAWRADEHEVARWCRLLAEGGIPADPADLLLPAPAVPSSRRGGNPVPPDLGAAPTVVHPGAAYAARRWPPDRFAEVARQLAADGHRVVVTGGAAERDLAAGVAAAAGLGATSVLTGLRLRDLAAVVAAARLVVCGDTGVAHLATAFARPSVVLFGPTPPAWWGPPPSARHVALWPAAEGYLGDPHGERVDPVLARIRPAEVLDACTRVTRADAAPATGQVPA